MLPVTYYFDGHTSILDPDNAWTNDAQAFDNDDATYAYTSLDGGTGISGNNQLRGTGTTAPASNGGVISKVEARVRGFGATNNPINVAIRNGTQTLGSCTVQSPNAAWGAYSQLTTTPTGGWTWSKLRELTATIASGQFTDQGYANKVELRVTVTFPGNMVGMFG